MNDDFNFDDVLNKMLDVSDKFVEAKKTERSCEVQKVMVLSMIIDFVKSGADLRVLPIQNDKVPVIIELNKGNDVNV